MRKDFSAGKEKGCDRRPLKGEEMRRMSSEFGVESGHIRLQERLRIVRGRVRGDSSQTRGVAWHRRARVKDCKDRKSW
jgi:hypothetical protein